MIKDYKLIFHKAAFLEYSTILENEEIKNKIADFLLKYVSIEAFYKKLLSAERETRIVKKLTKNERKSLRVTVSDVKRVLVYYQINIDEDLIERIFGSNDKNYRECSIKKLRDRLVHNVNENVLYNVLERYDSIMNDLNSFINLFK